jgi:two-component system NtrC family sensor kinase
MKNILITLLLVLCTAVTRAQMTVIDGINKQLLHTGQDTSRVLLMVELAAYYQFFNSDTALLLTEEAIENARNLNFKKGEIKAISRQGEVRHLRGELPQAFESELSAIQLSREFKYPETEAESLTFIGNIYLDLGEYRQALNYFLQAKSIYDKIINRLSKGSAEQFPSFVLSNIGRAYDKLKKFDTALYFSKMALNYPGKDVYSQADVLTRIGIAEARQKKYPAALNSLWEALKITNTSNDLLNKSDALYSIAEIYNQQNIPDSAIHYARLAFISAKQSIYKTLQSDAGRLLTKLYETKGERDSAFYFQQATMNINDSLFGPDKFQKLQLLALSEQQRVLLVKQEQERSKARIQLAGLLLSIGVFLLIALVLWRSNRLQKKANNTLNEKNREIEKQSENLKRTLHELKTTQNQLIQKEKMASLGELTAGIAHEIQNPLNFVNNFSEVNNELLVEMKDEMDKGNIDDAKSIANDVIENEQKINHHGKRADAIVKGMLQHSRSSTGVKEVTDINALCDEYLRLSYHGLRAKDKSFNATIKTDFDNSIGNINLIPQDIGRVVLNLINNAFYVVDEKKKSGITNYEPTVSISTKKVEGKLEVKVTDNGNGIPQNIVDKIFQPFFTTKPTGQGTGLGLSLSYDIVKAHGGEIKVETKEGEGSEFIITIPFKQHI